MSALTDALIAGNVAALLGVAGTLGAAYWSDRQTKVSASAAEFRDAVQALVDLRMQYYDYSQAHAADDISIGFMGSALNNKRQLHKSTAEKVEERASSQLTSDDYVTLGFEYESDAEFQRALRCYTRAREISSQGPEPRGQQYAIALRSAGGLLFRPTKLRDPAEADRLLRLAIAVTESEQDDYSRQTTGMSYEALAFGLWTSHNDTWRDALTDAKRTYQAMTNGYPERARALRRVDETAGFFTQSEGGHAEFALPPAAAQPQLQLDDVDAVRTASLVAAQDKRESERAG